MIAGSPPKRLANLRPSPVDAAQTWAAPSFPIFRISKSLNITPAK